MSILNILHDSYLFILFIGFSVAPTPSESYGDFQLLLVGIVKFEEKKIASYTYVELEDKKAKKCNFFYQIRVAYIRWNTVFLLD